jgi:hypothetical protein
VEARGGIEPPYKGFADLSLTTWVPRPAFQGNPQPELGQSLNYTRRPILGGEFPRESAAVHCLKDCLVK